MCPQPGPTGSIATDRPRFRLLPRGRALPCRHRLPIRDNDRTVSCVLHCPEVEVAVLGPLELRGVARPVARHAAVELIVYLAMHPRGVANEVWATALWPDRIMSPATLHSTASAARRALGRSASGRAHLPRRHGRLELAPSVGAEWRSALDLVRGRPLEGLRRSDWFVLEGVVAAVEESIVDLVISLAEHNH